MLLIIRVFDPGVISQENMHLAPHAIQLEARAEVLSSISDFFADPISTGPMFRLHAL